MAQFLAVTHAARTSGVAFPFVLTTTRLAQVLATILAASEFKCLTASLGGMPGIVLLAFRALHHWALYNHSVSEALWLLWHRRQAT